MELTEDLINKIAHLARLEIKPEELPAIKNGLSKMIDFAEKLHAIDTTGVAPLLHMSQPSKALREDIVTGTIPLQTSFQNAATTAGNYFTVPKVINNPNKED